MTPSIRRYRDADHDAVYDICVRTADAGGDARGQYRSDDLMPDLLAGPGHRGVRPRIPLWRELPRYPAHLHIDLLPGFQGFYDRVGFQTAEVDEAGGVTYLGRALGL